jgi:hypothetical protein
LRQRKATDGRIVDENFWKRLTSDLARVRKRRTLLFVIALSFGLITFVLVAGSLTAGRGSYEKWVWALSSFACAGIALLFGFWAQRF